MPDRSAEQIRLEIATERQGLADDLDVLRGQVRQLSLVALAGVVIASSTLLAGKLLWKRR